MKTYMTKLTPEQVAEYWDIIKYGIEQSLPPTVYQDHETMNNVLSAALTGALEVWAYYMKFPDKSPIFEGVGTTKIVYDEVTGTKSLLIYSLYGYNQASAESWNQKFLKIIKYAKGQGCKQVTAYTQLPYLIEMWNKFGADTSYNYMKFNIESSVKNYTD